MIRHLRVAGAAGLVLVAAVAGCRREPVPRVPPAPAADTARAAGALEFVDVAPAVGLDAVLYCGGRDKDHILESTGTGAALVDVDGDGRLDVYLVNAWALDEEPSAVRTRGRNVLYRNTGADGFEDVTGSAGVGDDGWGCGVCAADYDGNGTVDLYVTNFGPNRLYRNRGDGTFDEVGTAAGVADPGWGAGASFFDADGDGDLDLYVANYIDATMDEVLRARRSNVWRGTARTMTGPFGMRGGRDRFFRNNGDGTFTDATDAAGLTDLAEGYGLGVLASDLDDDGDVDLYVANDSNPNYLYRNDGDGTFTDVGLWSGAGFSGDGAEQAGMGVDSADVDGDGLPDIVVTNFARDTCTLYRNLGGLYFEDVTRRHEIDEASMIPLSWGCALFDADLDGDVDLFIVNGHIYPQVDDFPALAESYRQQALLLRNDAGRFVDVSSASGSGLQERYSGRGLAVGDVDDDGDLDLLVTAIDAPPLLLRNDSPRTGRWLKLRLLTRNGGPAIGARATTTASGLTQSGLTQSREVRSGSTYQSQSAFDLHFGLGAADTVDTVRIRWADGVMTTLRDVPSDQLIEVRHPAKP